jgi:predicted transcriptional regulator
MNVLLSIKPKYAELIKSGLKKYEFRRKIFKKSRKCTAYIYSTSPDRKIIGFFDASTIHADLPSKIWNSFGKYSGLSEDEFFKYFKNCGNAFAIEIKNLVIFDEPCDPSKYFLKFNPPQSYCYFSPEQQIFPFDKRFVC